MLKYLALSILALSSIFVVAGCGSSTPASSTTMASTVPSVPIPPDSIFAKVKVGMTENEVIATIGAPTTVDAYQTGKAFIPFHFSGSDDVRKIDHYKGVGTIQYTLNSAWGSGYNVMSIDYDPTDPGYAK